MTAVEKDIEKYMKAVDSYLFCYGKVKKELLSDIKDSIYVYVEENGIADIQEVYDHFGTPEEIAKQYLSVADPVKIKRTLLLYGISSIVSALLVVIISIMLVIEIMHTPENIYYF